MSETHGWKRPDIIVPVANRLPPPQRRKKPGATDEHQRSVGAIVKLSKLTLALAENACEQIERDLQRGVSPADRIALSGRSTALFHLATAVEEMLGLATKERRW